MRKTRLLAAVLCAAVVGAAAPEKTKVHGYTVTGTVAAVNVAAKTFVVRAATGKETTLVRTTATRLSGDALKVGDHVAVRWLDREGKKVATSIRIEPSAAVATPTAPASAAP